MGAGAAEQDGRRARFVGHAAVLGRRQAIAGVECTRLGMKPGGDRKVRISPPPACRKRGVPGLIPADAVLIVEIWLRGILPAS